MGGAYLACLTITNEIFKPQFCCGDINLHCIAVNMSIALNDSLC